MVQNQVMHLFIVNPRCFWNKPKMEEICARIRNYFANETSGADASSENVNFNIEISQFPRDAMSIIRGYSEKLPAETALRVYAVGGDGILFDCLNGVMGLANAELGAIPYGRTNNFIRGFGAENKSLFRNIDLQVKSSAVPLDVIHGGNYYALSFCSAGITSLTILSAQKFVEKLEQSGVLAQWLSRKFYANFYLAGAVPSCFNTDILQQRYEIEIDGKERFEGPFRGILIANSPFYAGNRRPIPSAMPNDGALDVVLARGSSPLHFIRLLPAYLRGRHSRYPDDFIIRRVKKIAMHSPGHIMINLDDQTFFDNHFTVELLPAAVRFIDVTGQGYQGVISGEGYFR
jgi:diacylglycerol kinase family enzyme